MKKIAIIGLGYVGLPLATEFGKKHKVVGFDKNKNRIQELIDGIDSTLETTDQERKAATHLSYTVNIDMIADCSIYIITVPTPIDDHKVPDLTSLEKSSKTVAKVLKKGDIVIYESTVYPGVTEEVCVPILEEKSGLKFNKDFYCGYSPERINPGDKKHRLVKIKKVTSCSTPEIATKVDELYQEIITAGTHKASSIRIAEAAKVIENTQRDVNIALINELSLIFNKLGIDTEEVLDASRITPPVMKKTGNTISVNVSLNTGMLLDRVWSPTHAIEINNTGKLCTPLAKPKLFSYVFLFQNEKYVINFYSFVRFFI